MKIHINKQSEAPVREQLREQIIYLLGTGKLPVSSPLPSVRELARQLEVLHNTVSHVYADLVREGWLITRAAAVWLPSNKPAARARTQGNLRTWTI